MPMAGTPKTPVGSKRRQHPQPPFWFDGYIWQGWPVLSFTREAKWIQKILPRTRAYYYFSSRTEASGDLVCLIVWIYRPGPLQQPEGGRKVWLSQQRFFLRHIFRISYIPLRPLRVPNQRWRWSLFLHGDEVFPRLTGTMGRLLFLHKMNQRPW